MDIKLKEAILLLMTRKGSEDEIFDLLGVNLRGQPLYTLDLLEKAYSDKDSDAVEMYLFLMDRYGYSNQYANVLCKILLTDWHFCHEDIVFTLSEFKDWNIISCLYNAASMRLNYLNYDETFQLARKCIKAIAEIDDSKATEKLIQLAKNDNQIIRQYAQKELDRKG